MIETKEETYHGVWFLPESKVKIQGYLRVTDFTIELYLTDPGNRSLVEDKDQRLERQNFPVIHGIGRYQEKITLYECSGFADTFDVKLMLYGNTHYKKIDEQKFKILGVHIPYFDKWISFNSFKKEITNSGYRISYNPSERIECELNSEITLSIEFECFAPSTENKNKISLHEFALVQFISNKDEGMSLSELFKYLLYFQQMVSFLARDGANISAARVYQNEQEFKRDKFLGTMI